MGVRQAVGIAVLVLAGAPGSSADPPDAGEYARVEVRAKLLFRDGTLDKPKVQWYEVAVRRPKEAGLETFRLDFTTKELEDLAKELRDTLVVVAGDLTIKTTWPADVFSAHQAVIRVTSLRRADPAKK